jgi:hypothetical protein
MDKPVKLVDAVIMAPASDTKPNKIAGRTCCGYHLLEDICNFMVRVEIAPGSPVENGDRDSLVDVIAAKLVEMSGQDTPDA